MLLKKLFGCMSSRHNKTNVDMDAIVANINGGIAKAVKMINESEYDTLDKALLYGKNTLEMSKKYINCYNIRESETLQALNALDVLVDCKEMKRELVNLVNQDGVVKTIN